MKNRYKILLGAIISVGAFSIASLSLLNKNNDSSAFAINTPDTSFVAMAGDWDNATKTQTPNYSHNILAFNKDLGTTNDATNQANANYPIGSALTIDGVAIKDIPNAIVSYAHGHQYLYVAIPWAYLHTSVGQTITVMHIDGGTQFINCFLPELSLHLVNVGTEETPSFGWRECKFTSPNQYWNNIENTNIHGIAKNANNVPTEGFCGLLDFSINLRGENKDLPINTNMATEAYEIGRNLTISGTRICDIPGSFVDYCLANNHLYFYFPADGIKFVGNSQRIVLEIKEGTRFVQVNLPHVKLMFNRYLGSSSGWVTYSEDTKTQKYFNSIVWNNITYSSFTYTNGGLLLQFNDKLSNNKYENGDASTTAFEKYNYVNTTIGEHIKYNTVPLNQIEGAAIHYFHAGYLYLYIPGMKTVPTGRLRSTITIDQGSEFFDSLLPEVILSLETTNGEWVSTSNLYYTTPKPSLISMNGTDYNGLCYTSILDMIYYESLMEEGATFGTFIIDANSYKNSGYSSIKEYILNTEESSTTYRNIEDKHKDFTNNANKYLQGYVSFTGSLVDISVNNYGRLFIGTGYYIINDELTILNESGESHDFYSIALEEANNGNLPNASRYLTYGVCLNETNKTYELVPNTNASSSYGFNYAENGYYALTAQTQKTVINISGKSYRVNIAANESKIFSYYNNAIHYVNSTGTRSGIAEPNKELWNDTNTSNYATRDNLSDLAGAFNCKSQRIWVNITEMLYANIDAGSIYNNLINYDNRVLLYQDYLDEIHDTIAAYRANGVEEIILMLNGFGYKWTDPVYLFSDGTWGGHKTLDADMKGGKELSKICHIIPDRNPSNVEEEDTALYNSFLATQKELYKLLAKEFTDADVFETLNELDIGGYVYTMDFQQNNVQSTAARMAKFAMDFSKALTDAVKEAGTNQKVMTPAMGCIDESTVTYNGIKTRPLNSKQYFTACYEYISSKGGLPKDYFQAVNLHPYVFNSKQTSGADSNYLYETNPQYNTLSSKRYKPDNTDWNTDWNTYIESLRTIMSEYNDSTYTSFYITEFGISDYGTDGKNSSAKTTDSSWKNLPSSVLTDVINNITNIIKTKSYFHTVMYFRMLDFAPSGTSVTETTECNYGVIDELYNNSMYLKKTGQAIYQILNDGSTDYSAVNSAISRMIARGGYVNA